MEGEDDSFLLNYEFQFVDVKSSRKYGDLAEVDFGVGMRWVKKCFSSCLLHVFLGGSLVKKEEGGKL